MESNTQTPTNKPTVLIAYHANCIDGFTAAWVTACAMNREDKKYTLLPMEYNQEGTDKLYVELCVCNYKQLFIVDFSVDNECLLVLKEEFASVEVVILDHHKTAFEKYCPDREVTPTLKVNTMINDAVIVLDNNHSGAAIAWQYFNPRSSAPLLVYYVEDYDLWRFTFPETKPLNKYLKKQLKEDPIIDNWSRIAALIENSDTLASLVHTGIMLQDVHDFDVAAIASKATSVEICGLSVLAVECPYEFTSDVGHTLATRCGTFGAMYQIDIKANKIKWSLRSVADFDVSAIAKRYGGGGHKNAAGFETKLFLGERCGD